MGGRNCNYNVLVVMYLLANTAQVTSNIRVSRQIARIMQDVKQVGTSSWFIAISLFAVQFILPIGRPVGSVESDRTLVTQARRSIRFFLRFHRFTCARFKTVTSLTDRTVTFVEFRVSPIEVFN